MDAEQYVRIREKLITYFSRRGRSDADILADETIMRVLINLSTGVELTVQLEAYVFGVARNVLLEAMRRDNRLAQLDPEIVRLVNGANPFDELWQKEVDRCLEKCWQALNAEEQKIYIGFYKVRATDDERKSEREELAKQNGVSIKKLRNRANWIRKKIIKCVRECLGIKATR